MNFILKFIDTDFLSLDKNKYNINSYRLISTIQINPFWNFHEICNFFFFLFQLSCLLKLTYQNKCFLNNNFIFIQIIFWSMCRFSRFQINLFILTVFNLSRPTSKVYNLKVSMTGRWRTEITIKNGISTLMLSWLNDTFSSYVCLC